MHTRNVVKVGDIIVVTNAKLAFNGTEQYNGILCKVTRKEEWGVYTDYFGEGLYLNHNSFEIIK